MSNILLHPMSYCCNDIVLIDMSKFFVKNLVIDDNAIIILSSTCKIHALHITLSLHESTDTSMFMQLFLKGMWIKSCLNTTWLPNLCVRIRIFILFLPWGWYDWFKGTNCCDYYNTKGTSPYDCEHCDFSSMWCCWCQWSLMTASLVIIYSLVYSSHWLHTTVTCW